MKQATKEKYLSDFDKWLEEFKKKNGLNKYI